MKATIAFYREPLTKRVLLALGCILAVGLALRLAWLWDMELWWDEFLTIHRARLPLGALWSSLNTQAAFEAATDTSPPLHHIIVHFFLLLGHHVATVKLASVVFGTASIAMIFAVGSRFFGRLAGLLAAAYVALLQYHIAYSRDLRWYPFFYFFSLASLYAFTLCVTPGRARDAVLWVLASAAMLYTSYVAAPFLAGEALFALFVLWSWWREGRRADAWRFLKTMAVAGVGLMLLYLPQVPGHLVTTRVFYVPGFNPAGPAILGEVFAKFAGFWRPQAGACAVAGGLVGLVGAVAAWRRGRGAAVLLLLCWGGVPSVAAFLVNVSARAQAKYFPGLLLLFVLFAGAGLAALAEAVGRRFAGRPAVVSAVAGLAGVLLLAGPNLDYREFYRPARPTNRQWARFLTAQAAPGDALVLERNRQRKVIFDWYLDGAIPYLSRDFRPGLHRFWYVGSGAAEPEGLPVVKTLRQPSESVTFARGAVLSESPIPLVPDAAGKARFVENFKDFSVWRHAAALDNLAPDFTDGNLALVGFDAPGTLVYTFDNPGGARLEAATLSLRFLLRDTLRGYPPDTRAIVEASADGTRWRTLDTISYDTFLRHDPDLSARPSGQKVSVAVAVPVPAACLGQDRFSVRVTIRPGGYGAALELSALALEADFVPGSAVRAVDAAVARCRALAQNAVLRPFDPAVRPLEGREVYGFSPIAAAIDDRLGGPAALAAYEAAGADEPLVRVTRADGSEVCRFYDPLRNGPALAVATGKPRRVSLDGPLPATFAGIRLEGDIAQPELRLGQARFAPGLSLPRGSAVALNPGGQGLVTFRQSFGGELAPVDNMIARHGLAEKTAGRAVTCKAGEPCAFSYLFASELPITGLRLTATPWVSPAGGQYVQAFYAVDDPKDRHTLFDFRGQGSGHWEAVENLTREIRLEKPGHLLYVGFSLSGDGAKVEATDTYPLRVDVRLDARKLAPPTVRERVFTVEDTSAYPNAYRLLLSRKPLSF